MSAELLFDLLSGTEQKSNWYIFNNHWNDLASEAQEECAIGAFHEVLCGWPIVMKEGDTLVFNAESKLKALKKIGEVYPGIKNYLLRRYPGVLIEMEQAYEESGYLLSFLEIACFELYIDLSENSRKLFEKAAFANQLILSIETGSKLFDFWKAADWGKEEDFSWTISFADRAKIAKNLFENLKTNKGNMSLAHWSKEVWEILFALAEEYISDEEELLGGLIYIFLTDLTHVRGVPFREYGATTFLPMLNIVYNAEKYSTVVKQAIVYYCSWRELDFAKEIAEHFFSGDQVLLDDISALQRVEREIHRKVKPGINTFDSVMHLAGVEKSELAYQVIANMVSTKDYEDANYMARLYLSANAYEKIRPQLEAIQIK